KLEVGCLDQLCGLDVDQPVAEHVGPQQHFSLAALELPQVELGAGELQHIPGEGTDLLDRHVDLAAAADRYDQAGDHGKVGTAQPNDHVGQPPDGLAALVGD